MLILALVAVLATNEAPANETPELVVQTGPGAFLTHAALSPDDRWLAILGDNSHVSLWDVQRGLLVRNMPGLGATGHGLRFSPDGKALYVTALYRGVVVFDVESGQVTKRLPLKGTRSGLALSKDGARLFVGAFDKIYVIETGGLTVTDTIAVELPQAEMPAESADGRLLAWPIHDYGKKAVVRLFDQKTLAVVRDLPLPANDHGRFVAFTNDGKSLVASTNQGGYGFDVATGAQRWARSDALGPVAPEPQGPGLLAGSRALQLLDPTTGKSIKELNRWGNAALVSSRRSKLVVHAGQKNYLNVCDVGAWTCKESKGKLIEGLRLAATPDGARFASMHGDGATRIWDARSGRLLRQLRTGAFGDIAFTPDGRHFVTSGGKPTYWDATTFTKVKELKADHGYERFGVGRGVFAAVDAIGGNLIAYSQETGAKLWTETKKYSDLAVSADGRYIAAKLEFGDVELFEASTGKRLASAKNRGIQGYGMTFSPDAKTLVMRGDGGVGVAAIEVYNVPALDGIKLCRASTSSRIDAMAYSRDGKTVATGHWKSGFEVVLWDPIACKVKHEIGGHTAPVRALAFINGDRHIASVGTVSGELRIDEVDGGKHVLTTVALSDGGFVSATPEGFYSASRNATDALRFSVGLRSFSYDLFDLRLHRPDLVLKALGMSEQRVIDAYYGAYKKRLERLGFDERDIGAEFHVPDLEATAAGSEATTARTVDIELKAKDARRAIERLIVAVNGVPLDGARGAPWAVSQGQEGKRRISVPLGEGDNDIRISVLNAAGAESERVRVTRTLTGGGRKPALFVFAVGVSKYRDSAFELDYAAKDARDLAALFAPDPARFSSVNVRTLSDGEVTREGIVALRASLERTTVDDHVILFFAGHGLLDDKLDFYYATHDVDFANPATRGVGFAQLEGLLEGIAARKKLLLLDTCHSGEVDKEEIAGVSTAAADGSVKRRGFKRLERKTPPIGLKLASELQRELFSELKFGSGATVLTSSAGAQYALESAQWKNGVFTYSLLQALSTSSADANKDKRVSVSELRDYVLQTVPALTGGLQTPTARAVNAAADFAVR